MPSRNRLIRRLRSAHSRRGLFTGDKGSILSALGMIGPGRCGTFEMCSAWSSSWPFALAS